MYPGECVFLANKQSRLITSSNIFQLSESTSKSGEKKAHFCMGKKKTTGTTILKDDTL